MPVKYAPSLRNCHCRIRRFQARCCHARRIRIQARCCRTRCIRIGRGCRSIRAGVRAPRCPVFLRIRAGVLRRGILARTGRTTACSVRSGAIRSRRIRIPCRRSIFSCRGICIRCIRRGIGAILCLIRRSVLRARGSGLGLRNGVIIRHPHC